MNNSKIIIAEKDQAARGQLAKALTTEDYPVATTGSAAQLFGHILQDDFQVAILGDSIEENLSLPALVRLAKRCNPGLSIILIADNITLCQERKIRHAGIFYHATRPDSSSDWEELQMVVACASMKHSGTNRFQRRHYMQVNSASPQRGISP